MGFFISGGSSEQELDRLLNQGRSHVPGQGQPPSATAADVEQLLQQMSGLVTNLQSQAGAGCELVVASSLWTKDLPIKTEYAAAAQALFQVGRLVWC
jgi:hypothetical protein